jgi:hypothetical protein
MEAYRTDFNEDFTITEFDAEKSQFVATAKINNSPLIIMAKLSTFTALQNNLFKGLIKGLQ